MIKKTEKKLWQYITEHFKNIKANISRFGDEDAFVEAILIKACPDRPFHTLVTLGMSDIKMDPEDEGKRIELMLCLPEDWKVDLIHLKNCSKWCWPLLTLFQISNMITEENPYFDAFHIIDFSDCPTDYFADNTKLCSIMLVPPALHLNNDLKCIEIGSRKIDVLCSIPIYASERDFALHGCTDYPTELYYKNIAALIERLDAVSVNRQNVVTELKK